MIRHGLPSKSAILLSVSVRQAVRVPVSEAPLKVVPVGQSGGKFGNLEQPNLLRNAKMSQHDFTSIRQHDFTSIRHEKSTQSNLTQKLSPSYYNVNAQYVPSKPNHARNIGVLLSESVIVAIFLDNPT